MNEASQPAQEHTIQKNRKQKDSVFFPKKSSYFFMSLAFFIVFLSYILPTPLGLSHGGQIMIGILVMAAILWITEPMPLAVTSLFLS